MKRKQTTKKLTTKQSTVKETTATISSRRSSILNYFSKCERPSTSAVNFVKKEDSDSDIEIISSSNETNFHYKSSSRTSSRSQFESCESRESDDDVILAESSKKVKYEQSTYYEGSSEENLNLTNINDSRSCQFEMSNVSFLSNKSTNTENERPVNDFKLCDLFQTPAKKQISFPFDLSCPSPYIKNISDTVCNQSFKDINEFLDIHLDDIEKVKTPIKSDTKKSPAKSTISSTESVRRELSFNDSPTKSSSKDQNLNLTDKKELTYSYINRKNFDSILKNVIDDPLNKCLFNGDDWNTISVYSSLSYDAQSLYLRLLFRKNSWIKRTSVKYNEFMDNLEELLDELMRSRFLIDTNELASLEEGLYILEPAEVKEFAKKSKVTIPTNGKKNMIECILNFARTTNTLSFSTSKISLEERKLNELKKFLGDRCFKVDMDNSKVFLRILFLYFPPIYFEKNLNMVLSETFFNLYNNSINLSTFPNCDSNKTIQVYTKRSDLVLYTDACILESMINENNTSLSIQELDDFMDKALMKYEEYAKSNLILDMNLPYFLRKLTAGQKLLCCISQCVTLLEKKKHYEEANVYLELLLKQNVYCLSSRGKWYDRLITNCESHLKDEKKAYEYCIKAFEDYCVRKAQELIIHKKAIRLAKKLKIESVRPYPQLNTPEVQIYANTIKRKVDVRNNIFYELDNDGGFNVIKVEQVALNYYLDELGYTFGLHSENHLFNIFFFYFSMRLSL